MHPKRFEYIISNYMIFVCSTQNVLPYYAQLSIYDSRKLWVSLILIDISLNLGRPITNYIIQKKDEFGGWFDALVTDNDNCVATIAQLESRVPGKIRD